ncbi:hypothetical protein [Kibdelosporangium phytohabitans]|uniref:Uncharacterized protein n=1 Tax=Kibdelosporangium phytohabitans TaxID=860235 RepID=A0A0N9IAD1_9PSEU|nr:hypothetical protein [Kibdelosporangium phytohabitans]ALG11707.1 hypothetical protein AOZ06_36860 [Kibdelosporangium phytohabitans]MBE1463101.1 hypothetical protein [Kibdelosporangium phytohabitans]
MIAAVRREADLTDGNKADVWRAREELRLSLGPVNLFAPQRIKDMMRDTMLPRSRLAMYLTTGPAPEWQRVRQLWDESQAGVQGAARRDARDLGLEALPGG